MKNGRADLTGSRLACEDQRQRSGPVHRALSIPKGPRSSSSTCRADRRSGGRSRCAAPWRTAGACLRPAAPARSRSSTWSWAAGPATPASCRARRSAGRRWSAAEAEGACRHITDHPVLPGLEPQHGEIVQQKTSAGAFATTGLAGLLHNMNVRDLVVCGQISYGCAGGTAIEATGWDYVVTMVDDASAAPGDQPGHLAFLRLFQQFVGRVWSSDEVIRGLTGNRGRGYACAGAEGRPDPDHQPRRHQRQQARGLGPPARVRCDLPAHRGHAGAAGAVGVRAASPPF